AGQQLEVAHRALSELNTGQRGRVRLQVRRRLLCDQQIYQAPTVGRDELHGHPWAYRTATRCRARTRCASRAPANSPTSGRAGVVKRSSTAISTWTAVRKTMTARKLSANATVSRSRSELAVCHKANSK